MAHPLQKQLRNNKIVTKKHLKNGVFFVTYYSIAQPTANAVAHAKSHAPPTASPTPGMKCNPPHIEPQAINPDILQAKATPLNLNL